MMRFSGVSDSMCVTIVSPPSLPTVENEAVLDQTQVERVGAVIASIEGEAVAFEDVEDRHLALVLDIGVGRRGRLLIERNGDQPRLRQEAGVSLAHVACSRAVLRRISAERRCASSPSARASAMAAGASAASALRVELQERRALHEVEHAETRGEACAARRRQHVVGAGDVIADHLRRLRTDEYGAGIADALAHGFGVDGGDLEMLGSDAVG